MEGSESIDNRYQIIVKRVPKTIICYLLSIIFYLLRFLYFYCLILWP